MLRYVRNGFMRASAGVIIGLAWLGATTDAMAVPSMARQTGYQCSKCHAGYPELTNFGRQFKLTGYTMSSEKWDDASAVARIPISAALQVSRTSSSDVLAGGTNGDGSATSDFPNDRKNVVQTAAIYLGGKIANNIGALVQYNYDGLEQKWGMEMFDTRYANSTDLGGKELNYGVTLNNNPTVSDIYNTTSAWGFPHTGTAAKQMPVATLIDMTLASKVAGVGFYGMWDDSIYLELANYRTAKSGALSFLSAGQRWNDAELAGSVVDGNAPYWRLAYQKRLGASTFEIGAYGMTANVWQDATDLSLGSNNYRDIAYDAHYHYLEGNHSASVGLNVINEQKTWSDGVQAAGMTSNGSDTLKTVRVDFHYYYRLKWGGGLQYFETTGSNNDLVYNMGDALMGSATGSPNSKGWLTELNYFPVENVKLALRYTTFQQFNGASVNYNGNGRNASDNNTVYLLGWVLF